MVEISTISINQAEPHKYGGYLKKYFTGLEHFREHKSRVPIAH